MPKIIYHHVQYEAYKLNVKEYYFILLFSYNCKHFALSQHAMYSATDGKKKTMCKTSVNYEIYVCHTVHTVYSSNYCRLCIGRLGLDSSVTSTW